MLSKLMNGRTRAKPTASVPAGTRVYAVGDIHGRLDLLEELLSLIETDDSRRAPAETVMIFLGDVLDRGPDSSGVVQRLLQLKQHRPSTRLLLGNHEEMFLTAITGDLQAMRAFCHVGGRETLMSYGLTDSEYGRLDYAEAAAALVRLVPELHLQFIAGFEDMVVFGDYVFVHAGIDPTLPLADQRSRSLRWIRQPFLAYRGPMEKVVVHGHTVHHEVELHTNRIGIDTGAYETGKLSAICLEGTERRILQT